jgi:predicted 3-demethylubiquinone-9 3-methyltransferase (glyoxalase superfamily)
MYRIEKTADGRFIIITPAGNPAFTTASEVYITTSRNKAEAALAYLNQAVKPGDKRTSAGWLKSTFGVF